MDFELIVTLCLASFVGVVILCVLINHSRVVRLQGDVDLLKAHTKKLRFMVRKMNFTHQAPLEKKGVEKANVNI